MGVNIRQLLQTTVLVGGSELHVSSAAVPVIRMRGEMIKLNTSATLPSDAEVMVSQILTEEQRAKFSRDRKIDLTVRAPSLGAFRVNLAYAPNGGIALVMAVVAEPLTGELPNEEKPSFTQSTSSPKIEVPAPAGAPAIPSAPSQQEFELEPTATPMAAPAANVSPPPAPGVIVSSAQYLNPPAQVPAGRFGEISISMYPPDADATEVIRVPKQKPADEAADPWQTGLKQIAGKLGFNKKKAS